MEEPVERIVEAPFTFSPYRRSHLRSGTYRGLVRLISLCYGDSPLATAPPIIPLHQTLDKNKSNQRELGENDIREPGQSNVRDRMEPASVLAQEGTANDGICEGTVFQDKEFSDTQTVINIREPGQSKVRDSREPVSVLAQEGTASDGSCEGTVFQYKEFSDRQTVIDIREPGKLNVRYIGERASVLAQEGMAIDSGCEGTVFQDKEFSGTQMVIDEIEQIMQTEESEDLLNRKDLMVNGSTEGAGFLDGEIARGQTLMDELESIVEGNEDYDDRNNSLGALLEQNQCDNCVYVSIDSQKEHLHGPLVLEESEAADRPQVDMKGVNEKIIEAFGFSSDKGLTVEVSKSVEGVEDQSYLLNTNEMHAKTEIQQKEMEQEEAICSNDRMLSPGLIVEDGQLEEGEISGDVQLVNESIDSMLEDDVLEKKVDEKQVSAGTFNDKQIYCNKESTIIDSECTSSDKNLAQITERVSEAKIEGRERDQMLLELGILPREKGTAKVLKQSRSENQVIKSKNKNVVDVNNKNTQGSSAAEKKEKKKKDVGVRNEKKQGPSSETKKEKRKQRKRKKQAEKNRQLGVKRLKLQTVLNPKSVSYCNHYLKGRCYEGEKCKFSHDTVPLTKSQPCCHFARHSCMKGDDCPFDHQLSKYPCMNYVTKGFCGRGDGCLFSHKISPGGDVAANSEELQLKLLSQGDFDMRLNVSRNNDASSCSIGAFSQNIKREIVAGTSTRSPDLACIGVSSVSFSKSSMAESCKLIQGSSSQKMKESGRVEIQRNQSTLGFHSNFASKPSLFESSKFSKVNSSLQMSRSYRFGIEANLSESGTIHNVNDSLKRKTEVVPMAVSFLSFGKSSLEDSSSKDNMDLGRGLGYKQHLGENEVVERGKVGNQTTQGALSGDQKKTDAAVVPRGINFLSFGKSNSRSNEAIASHLDIPKNESLQKSDNAYDKQYYSTQISGQSSVCLTHDKTPDSVEKALISNPGPKRFDNVKGKSVHESPPLSDKEYSSNATWKIPASPIATCQYFEKISYRNTPNYAQKALMSTLAFAAKFESGMKKNQAAVSTVVNSEIRDSRIGEASKSDLAKSSKFLDILSSLGSKIK